VNVIGGAAWPTSAGIFVAAIICRQLTTNEEARSADLITTVTELLTSVTEIDSHA